VLVPHAKLRVAIVPRAAENDSDPSVDQADKPGPLTPKHTSWARPVKRVFAIDIEHCPHCGGGPKIIAAIEDPEFNGWLNGTLAQALPRGALSRAIQYTLNSWPALNRYRQDGWLNVNNNPVENAIRGIAGGNRNSLFAGSESGGHRAALISSLVETCKLSKVQPCPYVVEMLTKLPSAKAKDLDAVLPWNCARVTRNAEGQSTAISAT